MKYYQFSLRFDLTDEAERRATEFMKSLDRKKYGSRNKFLLGLIADYEARQEENQQEDRLLEKVRQMLREELAGISVAAPIQQKAAIMDTTMTAEEEAANSQSVLAALEFFG